MRARQRSQVEMNNNNNNHHHHNHNNNNNNNNNDSSLVSLRKEYIRTIKICPRRAHKEKKMIIERNVLIFNGIGRGREKGGGNAIPPPPHKKNEDHGGSQQIVKSRSTSSNSPKRHVYGHR
ncbi:hypothetical protein, unlikely [Trypanosoma brucei gambiense DAL972]|uniref:Uncharacterized protein n=1 Tax=Trypanosoma brucei gambiense (strain MHOM/CI/86/DAL972) TaxID=679716 RepID=C9ZTL7_TRYB9|nr:hypothetical protein, unlikely [Trypanosoma brucei gambiense DAL972]CBH12752.1 hypothetical protein, unlikely [Trypanosoma brucei gambiense DAL972]|eukprot:XP_011775032.1 hypothetical protein, unlikely [Trypanosoma brucei gambiense DAL972]